VRVTLLLNRDLHANIALNLLAPALQRHEVTIFLSDGLAGQATVPTGFAPLAAAERHLPNKVLWPLADAAPDRGASLVSFARCAERLGAPCEPLTAPNSDSGLARLRAAEPDVIVSIRYGRILREQAIAIPAHGVINLHSGPLPAYRGVMATFRALLNDDDTIGCTLHYIADPGIDSGPIIGVELLPAPTPAECSLFGAIQRVYPAGCRMIADAIGRLARGQTLATHAPSSKGTYYSWPTDEDLVRFVDRGYRLVDETEYVDLLSRYVDVQ
jgi:methionyl-tRNA formyltransferase